MNILCTLFSLSCPAIIPEPPPYFTDIIINAPYCIEGEDNSLMIQGLIDEVSRIQEVTTPSSDAAANDLYGAQVTINFNRDKCEIHKTINLSFQKRIGLMNGYFYMPINEPVIKINHVDGMEIRDNKIIGGNYGLSIKND